MDEIELDLVSELGASSEGSPQILTLYIPSVDRYGKNSFDQEMWVKEAGVLLSAIGGGVTINPPSKGGWKSPTGEIIWEDTIILYSYVDGESLAKNIKNLKKFLHRLGREANQGEVACQFDGVFYKITEYDQGV
ncbi:hypothetical protein [Leptospira vanthielii]|jgi:hypothetical protein|uniref:Uncharacterized protein n=1 Tax=Leptospira vanthielii serovar Holland str. Waz Holland = ATCC 700522 TaxID=1218591 RepID=N1WE99_9LEPT|nr:hypothetical protein [Leptospira vanthielii]EMY71527.1 hypothetical protein LEP1GSC199_1547 [Leptospira vanthielii serovar Holland str. Waz Holland = ATCC 700522]